MANYSKVFVKESGGFDEGLRDYMLKIYNFMALGLLTTGIFAFATLHFPSLSAIMFNIGPDGEFLGTSGLGMVITFAPLGIAVYFFMGMNKMSTSMARSLFWVYAALMGMSLSYLGLVYTGQSLVRTFLICSSVFGAMSLYGYTTKKDLTSMGSFMIMGLIGLIVVSIINLFLQSSAIHFATSLIGIAVFMGLTAWDVQKLKSIYFSVGGGAAGQKMAILGAFTLYLDFINLFLYMLRLFGDRK